MKTIAMLLCSCVVLAAFVPYSAAAQPGAPRGAAVDDKDVVKAAQFAIDAQQKAMKDAGQPEKLALVKIVSAKKQVVAGMNFLLTLEVKQGETTRTASAKVWWQAWRKVPYQLTSWKFSDESNIMTSAPIAPSNEATTANNGFAVDLYRQLAKEKQGKNVFFSPYSMMSTLAMTANGARGETAAQMGKVLCFPASARLSGDAARPWNFSIIDAGLSALNARFNPKPADPSTLAKIADLRKQLDDANRKVAQLENQPNSWQAAVRESDRAHVLVAELNPLLAAVNQYELRVANALWAEKTYPFSSDYLDTIHKYYGTGGAFPVDFKGNAEAERQKINAWVEQQTSNRIRDLMPSGSIDAATRLVLTNAIYFKGEWAEPFSEGETKDEEFYTADRTNVQAAMMHKWGLEGARYAAFRADGSFFATPRMMSREQAADTKSLYPGKGGFLMAELPYKGGDLAMVAIVPQDADGLAALEEKLSGEKLQEWLGKLEARAVNVQLPKFKLETDYQMNGALKSLGMVRAFSPDEAQFDGMTSSQDAANKLYIALVVHKAFVEVNEKGTEAAAATGVAMAAAAIQVSVPFTPMFRADHPFLFAIRDVKSGTILFLGRLTNPKG